MLTDSERAWLENRKPGDWCVTHDCSAMFEGECISVTCYMDISWLYRDAAEFEARVAVKLADMHRVTMLAGYCEACPAYDVCQYKYGDSFDDADVNDCASAFLQYARLMVEEEMDNDR